MKKHQLVNSLSFGLIITLCTLILHVVNKDFEKAKEPNPKAEFYQESIEYCGTKINIENSGCDSCFIIAVNKEVDMSWVDSLEGCNRIMKTGRYIHQISIPTVFDATTVLSNIKAELKSRLCD